MPALPWACFVTNPVVESVVFDMANLLGVRGLFYSGMNPT